ncbi:hypothetical protein B2G71_20620 [Novosphingobium sp. PC22D]|nr:hypothetical protein B2G71_20620 [Novosphingobium sp. PC22D]
MNQSFTLMLCAGALLGVTVFPAGARQIPENAMERLRAADTNGDGAVSRAEFLAMRASQWQRFDRDSDGYFSRDDLPGFAQKRWDGDRISTLRQEFDTNRDGRISRAEFVDGPTTLFDLADTDRDGRVTEAEAQAMTERAENARARQ